MWDNLLHIQIKKSHHKELTASIYLFIYFNNIAAFSIAIVYKAMALRHFHGTNRSTVRVSVYYPLLSKINRINSLVVLHLD